VATKAREAAARWAFHQAVRVSGLLLSAISSNSGKLLGRLSGGNKSGIGMASKYTAMKQRRKDRQLKIFIVPNCYALQKRKIATTS
jgi:hypothetical protein